MLSILDILQRTEGYFAQAGIERPKVEAEWLVACTLGLKRLELYLQHERPLTEPELAKLRPLVKRRAQREPLQYLVGTADFAGLKLACDQRALIPRPETEALVDLLIEGTRRGEWPAPARIVDAGTGTGAIALALAQAFPSAHVMGLDQSPDALALAHDNAAALAMEERVAWQASDWLAALTEPVDWIVSNPPYLTASEWAQAAPEVRDHEPKAALVAADEGLRDLQTLLQQALAHLRPGGLLALETGIAHHAHLAEASAQVGYARWEGRADFSGRPRYWLAWKAN